MKIIYSFLICGWVLGVYSSFGENSLTDVKALVQEALIANVEIQAAGKKWEAAKQRAIQSGILEDPMAGVEFEGVPTDTVDLGQYQDIEWSISQMIPFPGKLSLKRKVALQEAEQVYLEYLEKVREVVAGVKIAYADFYLIYQTQKILERNEQLLSQFLLIAQKKYEVGKVSQQDVLKAQVELMKTKNKIEIQRQEREAAAAKINMLIARLPQEPLGDPAPFPQEPMELNLDPLISVAVKNRPELRHHELRIKANEYQMKLAKRQYWPDFFTRLESRQFQGTGLEEYDVMFGVSIPWLWTRSRLKSGNLEAQANLEAARNDYEARKLMIFFEIKETLVKVKTSQSLVKLYRSDVLPVANQVVEVTQAGYQTDKVDFLTLLDSQRNLLDFQLEYEQALSDYHKNLAQLERNVGVAFLDEGEQKQEIEMRKVKD